MFYPLDLRIPISSLVFHNIIEDDYIYTALINTHRHLDCYQCYRQQHSLTKEKFSSINTVFKSALLLL